MHNIRKLSLLLVFSALFASHIAFAHSVGMNLRFHISGTSDDIHVNGTDYSGSSLSLVFGDLSRPYISSERNGAVVALIAASPITRIALDTRSDPYLFSIEQNDDQRLLVALTNGTWSDIESKASGKTPASVFGKLAPPIIAPGLALQLQPFGAEINGLIESGQILIRSLGKSRLPIIDIQTA